MFRNILGLLFMSSFAFCFIRITHNKSPTTILFSNAKVEVVGIIIVDHGSRRAEANNMLLEIVKRYEEYSKLPIVEPAHMELAEPSIEVAFQRCVARGASKIICHPFFLSYGRHVQEDIPALMAAAAEKYPEVAYSITRPLGKQEQILELIHNAISANE